MQNIQINKIKGLIHIAEKAGYVIIGADNLKAYSKKLFLILKAQQCGTNLDKIANNKKTETACDIQEFENNLLEELCGKTNCKIIGIKNKGISEEILKIIRGEYIV